jgi:CheY-like chemotaxis protein
MLMPMLADKRILVVEDEPLVAMALEDMLLELGCRVIGPALRLDRAAALARVEPLDAAVLDVNMSDGTSDRISDILSARSVPFLFATGYARESVEAAGPDSIVLQKPYRRCDLKRALERLFSRGAT